AVAEIQGEGLFDGLHAGAEPLDLGRTTHGLETDAEQGRTARSSGGNARKYTERCHVHLSMTTAIPNAARKAAALHAEHGSVYVEAPIFGIPAQAVARTLTVGVAGPGSAKARVHPLLEAMGAKHIVDFGEATGSGGDEARRELPHHRWVRRAPGSVRCPARTAWIRSPRSQCSPPPWEPRT